MSNEEKVNILMVDDHPENLLALDAILSDLGQNLVKAHSGKEALRELLSYEFAVILMDVHMPEMDGFETAALIRHREKLQHTPIIFLTAMDKNDSSVFKGYSVGAVDYIFKPFNPDILRAKVNVFIDLFRKTREVKRQADLLRDINRELGMTNKAIGGLYNQLESKNTELRTERDFINAIFQTAGTTVVVLDAKGNIQRFNHTAEEQSGFSSDEVIGKPLWELVKADNGDSADRLAKINASQGSISEEEEWKKKDGTSTQMATTYTALRDSSGDVAHIITTALDITERKRSEEKIRRMNEELEQRVRERTAQLENTNVELNRAKDSAEQANKAKDQFLAVLSHELRTPLTPVLSIVQVLEEEESLPPEMQTWVKTIRRNIELEARLIDDLLDITRIANGKIQLNVEAVDVHGLVDCVIDICNDDIKNKQINFAVRKNADHSRVKGDSARLQQVLWNLLKNAVKFTPSKGKIEMATTNDDEGNLVIEVRDSGIGIQPEMLKKIFNAFEQGDKDITRQFGGLGLGLAITKAMVEAHGGQIIVDSQGKDKGASFKVVLHALEGASKKRPNQKVPMNGTHANAKILLVEDNFDTSKVMKVLLERRGFTVEIANSVAESIEAARATKFDLVISDIGLPDGSGLDIIKALNAIHPVRSIALSGLGMEDDIRKSLDAGFDMHLVKPVNFEQLHEAVTKLLQSAPATAA
ncbi:MAG TPA: response regulator [Candidatus Kapabacteria bacterium]|nr:response regulator [Candidatus Kapabacteria bacterium]